MHAKVMAALVAGVCLLGVQASAQAQAVSAYPQSWMAASAPATSGSADQSTKKTQEQTAAGYFDQYSRNSNGSQASAHCDGNYDPYNDTCYSADIHTPSHE
jgi:hypothetical protein